MIAVRLAWSVDRHKSTKISDGFHPLQLICYDQVLGDHFSSELIRLIFEFLILLNIMFHAPMGRFQLELFIFITYLSTVVPFNVEWDDGGKIAHKNK